MTSPIEQVEALRLDGDPPCEEGILWMRSRPEASFADLWVNCDRGDWMLWGLEAAGVEVPLAWRLRWIVAPALRAAAWVHPDERHRQALADAADACCASGAGGGERVRAAVGAEDARVAASGAARATSGAARAAAAWAAKAAAARAAAWAASAASAAGGRRAAYLAHAARDARAAYLAHLADAVRASFDCPLKEAP